MKDKVYEKRFSEQPAFWLLAAALFSLLYFYIFARLKNVDSGGSLSVIWLLLCVAMTGLSYLARRTGRVRGAELRRFTDRAGSLWGLFVVLACCFIGLAELVALSFSLTLNWPWIMAVAFAASAAAIAFGVKQAYTIRSTRLTVKTDKLPEGQEALRIVQLTDLHLGPYTGVLLLAQILRRVREAAPDMLVVTGDLADGKLTGRGREISMFRRIRPPFGTFAVTGNHDYYDDIDKALDFMKKCGMKVLDCEAVESGGIVVAGADDRDHLRADKWGLTRSETLLVNAHARNRDKFLLFLRHRPVVETGTEGFFDLQLSGHTHGGQLFPLFSSRLKLVSHPRGLKKLKKGSSLYTSNGAGFVGPPVRFFAPPEIVIIDLIREKN